MQFMKTLTAICSEYHIETSKIIKGMIAITSPKCHPAAVVISALYILLFSTSLTA